MNRYGTVLITSLFVAGIAFAPSLANARSPQSQSDQRKALRNSDRQREWLEQQVRHKLVMLPYYGVFDNLAFRVSGYRVELLGQVARPSLRSDAEAAVKRIEGVEQVVNNIEVLPTSILDDRLRRDLYRAIFGDGTLARYSIQSVPPIHIIVKNGHVTLEGVVASEMDKNIAGLRANGVPNVFSVTNNLRVEK